MRKATILSIAYFMAVVGVAKAQTTVEIPPAKNNTLYEHGTGALSNGAGEHLFAGNTATGLVRRAVLQFPVAENVPADATITSVELTLNMSRTISGPQTVAVHPMLADWGEGTSAAAGEEGSGAPATTDDATWLHRFYDTQFWDSPGGDFSGTPSASLSIGNVGSYTWQTTPELVADVQHWLDNPEENFGWILIGNEAANTTSKRFDSRHHGTSANRPLLAVTYTEDLPVELVDFRSESRERTVTLHWTTASETNNDGFEVQRQTQPGADWEAIGFVRGAGNTTVGRRYTHVDELNDLAGVPSVLHYRLRQIDFDGTATFSDVLSVDVGVPDALSLGHAFPNPALTGSNIPYAVPVAQQVRITLYDVLGRAVQVLVDGHHESGWHQARVPVEGLAPGLYHYELRTGQAQMMRQLVVLP